MIPGYPGFRFFLVYMRGKWWIQTQMCTDAQNSTNKRKCFLWDKAGGLFRLTTKGKPKLAA